MNWSPRETAGIAKVNLLFGQRAGGQTRCWADRDLTDPHTTLHICDVALACGPQTTVTRHEINLAGVSLVSLPSKEQAEQAAKLIFSTTPVVSGPRRRPTSLHLVDFCRRAPSKRDV